MSGLTILLLSSWFAATPTNGDQTLVTATGERMVGRLLNVDPNWTLTLDVQGRRQNLSAGEWAIWGRRRDSSQRPVLLMTDGGLLTLEAWQLSPTHLAMPAQVTGIWRAALLPRDQLRGLILQPPADKLRRDQLQQRLLRHASPHDELLLENEDVVTGQMAATWSPASAARDGQNNLAASNLPDDSPTRLEVKTKSADVAIATERVQAIAWRSLLAATERPRRPYVLIGLRDGTALFVRRIVPQGGDVQLVLTNGVELTTDAQSLWDEVACVQFFGNAFTYVSDLEPLGYKHIPFLNSDWQFQRDRAVGGGQLRSGGRLFTKGIGMHSTSRLAYELPHAFRSLQGELAIDDRAATRGSVIFRVFVDRGNGQWQAGFESPIVRGGDASLALNVDLTDVSRMALIVDFADHGDELDHANWLNLRLVK